MNNISHSELLRLWGIQESLLQTYRSIFLSTQSIFISLGAALALASTEIKQAIYVLLPISFMGIYLLFVWLKVTRQRSAAVNFCQEQVIKLEDGEIITKPLQNMNSHLKSSGANHKGDDTRKKLQSLPYVFLTLWIILLCFSVYWVYFR